VYCFYAAQVLKTRAAWLKLHDSLQKQVATTAARYEEVTRGKPGDFEGKEPSVASLRGELDRILAERGRVWRGCVPTINRQTGAVTVQTSPPPDPNNPAAPPPAKNNIQPKTVLHVFREGQVAENLVVPVAYVGEFRAASVADDRVVLEATMPLAPDQVAAGQAPGTWALYETCPVDNPAAFQGLPPEELARLIPQPVAQSYQRDGQAAQPTDPPDTVWVEVRFTKPYRMVVDAPSAGSSEAELFDAEGQALAPWLRRASPGEPPQAVEFGPGENQIRTAVLDLATAQSLIDQQVAEEVRRIYRRPLNDYERLFRSVNARLIELNTRGTQRVSQLQHDTEALQASVDKAGEQQRLIEDLKAKTAADLQKVTAERDGLRRYQAALANQVASVTENLSQLYRSNKALARELREVSARLTEEIDRRTREAVLEARRPVLESPSSLEDELVPPSRSSQPASLLFCWPVYRPLPYGAAAVWCRPLPIPCVTNRHARELIP
jgi:hypothetical protein